MIGGSKHEIPFSFFVEYVNTKYAFFFFVEYVVYVSFGSTKWTQNMRSEDKNRFRGPCCDIEIYVDFRSL